MTSTDSKYRAACCAKCMDSTAPIAKFGAMSTATSGLAVSQLRTCPSRLSSNPVVPTTA